MTYFSFLFNKKLLEWLTKWISVTTYCQVLAALGTGYFERILPDIIRNCSHQKASVRDGYLTLFKVKTGHYFFKYVFWCLGELNIIIPFMCFCFVVSTKVFGCSVSELFAAGAASNLRW